MKQIFSVIGMLAVIAMVIYFCIITPLTAFQELSQEKCKYEKLYNESVKENKKIYNNFEQALRWHLPEEKIEEIYSDPRFFAQPRKEFVKINMYCKYQ